MSHGCVTGTAERLGVEVRVVELAVDLAGSYLSKGNLLLDIIDDHQEFLASALPSLVMVMTVLLSSITMAGRVIVRRIF